MEELKLYEGNSYVLDTEKIKTVEDIVLVLKGLNIQTHFGPKETTETYTEMLEKGFLKLKE